MAEMIHSDSELSQKMEPATQAPEAGPSNTELVENSHAENGGSPVLDGDLHPSERQNVTAIKDALEAQNEMEIGKPIAEKEQELESGESTGGGKAVEIDAKPGKQIIINIAGKQAAITSGINDIQGGIPSFKVNYKLNGKDGMKEFSSQAAAEQFMKGAASKFGSKLVFAGQVCSKCLREIVEQGVSEEEYRKNPKAYCPQCKTPNLRGEAYFKQHGPKAGIEEDIEGSQFFKESEDSMKPVHIGKKAGFNFFFPGQVLKEFYPEVQHEIVDYPNANNSPMGLETPEITGDGGHELEGLLDDALGNHGIVEAISLPADVSEPEEVHMAADYVSTSPAGAAGIGRDGKPEVLEGVPLRKENDIRGLMFTDEFYGQYEGVPGAMLTMAAHANNKTAAEGAEKEQFAEFIQLVCGEIAATMVGAFKATYRPLLDQVPGVGEVQLANVEQAPATNSTMMAGTNGVASSRVKYLMSKLNDGDIKDAINGGEAQAAVWCKGSRGGGFVYEVFVRAESIDTDSMIMKYKFVCGTKE